MKIKKLMADYTDTREESGTSRFIGWECDKCKMLGHTWVGNSAAEDLPEDQKRHCE